MTSDIIYWKNPIRSAVMLIILLMIEISLLKFTAFTVVGYIGLFVIIANCIATTCLSVIKVSHDNAFLKFIYTNMTDFHSGTEETIQVVSSLIMKASSGLKDAMLATTVSQTLKFGLIFFMMTVIGARINFIVLTIVATIIIFTIPKIYDIKKETIDSLLNIINEKCTAINDKCADIPLIGKLFTKSQISVTDVLHQKDE